MKRHNRISQIGVIVLMLCSIGGSAFADEFRIRDVGPAGSYLVATSSDAHYLVVEGSPDPLVIHDGATAYGIGTTHTTMNDVVVNNSGTVAKVESCDGQECDWRVKLFTPTAGPVTLLESANGDDYVTRPGPIALNDAGALAFIKAVAPVPPAESASQLELFYFPAGGGSVQRANLIDVPASCSYVRAVSLYIDRAGVARGVTTCARSEGPSNFEFAYSPASGLVSGPSPLDNPVGVYMTAVNNLQQSLQVANQLHVVTYGSATSPVAQKIDQLFLGKYSVTNAYLNDSGLIATNGSSPDDLSPEFRSLLLRAEKLPLPLGCSFPNSTRRRFSWVSGITSEGLIVGVADDLSDSTAGPTTRPVVLEPVPNGSPTNYCPTAVSVELQGKCGRAFKKDSASTFYMQNGAKAPRDCTIRVALKDGSGKVTRGVHVRLKRTLTSGSEKIFLGKTDKRGSVRFRLSLKGMSYVEINAPYNHRTLHSTATMIFGDQGSGS